MANKLLDINALSEIKKYIEETQANADDSTLRGRKVFYLDNTSQLTPSFIQEIITTGSTIGYNNIILIISHFFTDRRCGMFTYSESVPLESGVGRCERFIGVHYSSIESSTKNGLTTTTAAYPMLDLEFDNDGNFADYHMTFVQGDRTACFLSTNDNAGTFVPARANDPANKAYVDNKAIFHDVTLNADGSVAATPTSLNIDKVISNINKGAIDFLRVTWESITFLATSTGFSDTDPSVVQFIASFEAFGQQRYMVFTLDTDNKLTTMKLLTFESVNNKTDDIITNAESSEKYASTKGVFTQFQRKPEVVYSDPTGFEASNSDIGKTWHLENLDLSKYKRLKFYVKAAGDSNDSRTPSHIVEMHLDDRAKGDSAFTAGHMSVNPNNKNRIHCVTFAVNNEKTAIQFVAANSLYGTATTSSSGSRNCYLIEGYFD